nr:glycosyltransferase [Providencia rettgeri]
MKFLFINKSEVFGGQERYAESILKSLKRKGIDIFFSGTPIELKKSSSQKTKEYSIAILNGNSALYQYLLKPFPGHFVIYVQHSNINDAQAPIWKRWIRKTLLRILFLRVNLVIRVCNQALPDNYAKGKIVTIYNGIPIPDIHLNTQKKFNFKLLMVGALTKNKNQKMAIEALTKLPQATLTLVGEGPEQANLEALTKQLGVNERVTFTGFIKNPSEYYQTHDLLLMLSNFEAFPYVVLESMAAFCPVVSVKVGGVPEAIQDNVNGWLLDSYSPKKLASKIEMISNNIVMYKHIANTARSTVEKRFTEEQMVIQLLQEINKRYKRK